MTQVKWLMMRQSLCRVYEHWMVRTGTICEDDLRRSAVVFAPHPDDETLGCGGTVIRKCRAGADVTVVFMTDGSQSHAHLMPRSELRSLRMVEARAACRVLGVDDDAVVFLDFEDGCLEAHINQAVGRVAALLDATMPDAVYIPYRLDGPSDHAATYHIVQQALHMHARQVHVFEYPIWFWQHWPWVAAPRRRRQNAKQFLRTSVRAGLGMRMLVDFRHHVWIGDVIDAKERALAQHRSQTCRLLPDAHWATLDQVSGGEWLTRFFQDREVFLHYLWHASPHGRPNSQ